MTMRIYTISSKLSGVSDIYMVMRPCVRALAVWAGLALCTAGAFADSIVYKGVLYDDVLVYKGSTSYYVKVPDEGRVFNVPNRDVNPSQVSMVHDPYYRDELKLRFEKAKKRLQSGEVLRKRNSGNSFSLVDTQGEELSASDLLEGAGGNPGLGISRESVETLLAAAGMTMGMVGGVVTATKNDSGGSTTIKLYGPSESLTKIHVQASARAVLKDVLMGSVLSLQGMMTTFVPWAGPWMQSNMKFFQRDGKAEETQDGRRIEFSVKTVGSKLVVDLVLESV